MNLIINTKKNFPCPNVVLDQYKSEINDMIHNVPPLDGLGSWYKIVEGLVNLDSTGHVSLLEDAVELALGKEFVDRETD